MFRDFDKITADDNAILVFGAREHNLKNINVRIPRGKFVVITGVSGSGKSTLAFDILFSEGQRRFLDSINAYARQFVEQLPRPDVDLIIGLPPTVSIEQRISRGGGKSTVATVTEIYHFLRLLFAKVGTQFCPDCNCPVQSQTIEQIVTNIGKQLIEDNEITLLAPIVKGRKGFYSEVARWARNHNFSTIRADGKFYSTDAPFRLDRYKEHNIEIVTGKIVNTDGRNFKQQFSNQEYSLIKTTIELGSGTLFTLNKKGKISVFSTHRSCPICGISFEPLDPKIFSYNSPSGWCPRCKGFGEIFYLPDVERGARADAIEESWFEWMEGEREICPECNGTRINKIARSVHLVLEDKRLPKLHEFYEYIHPTIDDFAKSTVERALKFFEKLKFTGHSAILSRDIIPEITGRLKFLKKVGLDYLQLGRAVTTLSGGEAQRIRLAAQLGSNLCGVLYVLDEPTIGLHPRDNEKLLLTLMGLKEKGNSIIVVEHDEATIRVADYIIDLGPGAGIFGGNIVAAGTLNQILKCKNSITAACLKTNNKYPSRGFRRQVVIRNSNNNFNVPEHWLILKGARLHNLKNLTVEFPLGRFIAITGVSGSGKSTLIHDCLLPSIKATLEGDKPPLGMELYGCENVKAVYEIDQSPIGRTPRSIPATYIGFFDEIRRLFSILPEARLRGYKAGRFSFNSQQGRCPECSGMGVVKMEMSFIPPAYVRCVKCNGLRFNPETLDIKYNGKNIAEVLEMSVDEAINFFSSIPSIYRPLQALKETGLDYLKLGQPSPTLSGGEAQRIKLVAHLLTGLSEQKNRRINVHSSQNKSKIFILEEPTIGLHNSDVFKLVQMIQKLVDLGNTVIVIEHNLELIAEADWIIDLGLEGGEQGGEIIAIGTPEDVAMNRNSYTGKYLKKLLQLK